KSPSVPPPVERSKSPSVPPPRPASPSQPPPFDRAKSPTSPPPLDRAKSPTRPPPRPASSGAGFGGETLIDPSPAGAQPSADASSATIEVAPTRPRSPEIEPPPTRIHRPEGLVDRPFAPPKVNPVPEIPEPGLVAAARY